MKTNVYSLSATVPKNDYDPSDNGKRQIPIATTSGDLMINRLRRLMRFQDQTKNKEPDERFTIDVPNELMLQIVEAYHKKSKAMGRMDKALDRKSEAIATLEQTLKDQNDVFEECADCQEAITLILGALMDLLDVATEFRAAVVINKGNITVEQLQAMNDQLEITEQLLDDLQVEVDDAEEEEKDD